MVFLERTSRATARRHGRKASAREAGGIRPSFSRGCSRCAHRSHPGTRHAGTPQVPSRPCVQRPNAFTQLGLFRPLSLHAGAVTHQREASAEITGNSEGNFPTFRAEKPFTRCLKRPAEWSFWTRLEATGGTQTHSRRTGGKLGRLRRARQAIVRLSESNTKYGGKAGITGVIPRL